jgi:cell division protein FtsB
MDRPRRSGVAGLIAIIIAVVIVGGLAGIFPFHQILASDAAVEMSERKLEALRDENRRLEHQIRALHSPEEVERLAREEFGFVMPGEVGYVAVPLPGNEDGPGVDPVAEDHDTARPWWRALWDFVTGRDLAGDE